jgi:hypothetical protein
MVVFDTFENPHLIVPVFCSTTGSTTTPSFEYLEMSKTAKDNAQEMKRDESARTRPVGFFLKKVTN